MRAVTYNIQFGRGKDGRCDLERCLAEVRGADIIALQEVERFWRRSGLVDQPAVIGELFPDHHWVYGPSFDVHLENAVEAPGLASRHRRRHPRRRRSP